jgi:hypothetical protein
MEPVLLLLSTASEPIVVSGARALLLVCRFLNNRRNQGNTLSTPLSRVRAFALGELLSYCQDKPFPRFWHLSGRPKQAGELGSL